MAVPPPAGSKPIYYEVPSFDSIDEERKYKKEQREREQNLAKAHELHKKRNKKLFEKGEKK